jgi:hypothetical protein
MPAATTSAVATIAFALQPVQDSGLASHLRRQLAPTAEVGHANLHEPSSSLEQRDAANQQALPSIDASPWRIAWQGTPDAQATPDDDSPKVPVFGAKGSRRWTVLGGFGDHVAEPRNTEAFLGLGLQYYIVDGFAFAPQVKLWGFFQSGEDAIGGSLDLLFQWHMIRRDTWSFFGDFGCGMLGTNENVPIGGSQFNFTPQAGFGFTFDVGNDRRAVIGLKWHHISNASLYRTNPGRDSLLVYGGLNLPF